MEQLLPDTTPYDGVPYVGCAATIHIGSDCYPATVVWVSPQTVERKWAIGLDPSETKAIRVPARILIEACLYRGVKGHCNAFTEDQRYEYYTEYPLTWVPRREEYSWRPRRRCYVRAGEPWRRGTSVGLGCRRAYMDPSF